MRGTEQRRPRRGRPIQIQAQKSHLSESDRQTGARSAPEFEKGDNGADISVRRMAGALGGEVPRSTLRASRRQRLPPATTPGLGKSHGLKF